MSPNNQEAEVNGSEGKKELRLRIKSEKRKITRKMVYQQSQVFPQLKDSNSWTWCIHVAKREKHKMGYWRTTRESLERNCWL